MLGRALIVACVLCLAGCGGRAKTEVVDRRVVNALELGVRAMRDGRERVAIQSFELAIESAERASDGEGAARARYATAQALLRLGDAEGALESADGAIALTEDPSLAASAHLLAGEALSALGRFGEVGEHLTHARRDAPSGAAWEREIAIARAKATMAAGDAESARDVLAAVPGGGLALSMLRVEIGLAVDDADLSAAVAAVELAREGRDARVRARAERLAGLAYEAQGETRSAARRLLVAGRAFASFDGGRDEGLRLLRRAAELAPGTATGRAARRSIQDMDGSE